MKNLIIWLSLSLTLPLLLVTAIAYAGSFILLAGYNTEPAEVTQPKPTLVTPERVESALNHWRVDNGFAPYQTDNPALDAAAQARAEQMCRDNQWSHANAWPVLDQHYAYVQASENLYHDTLSFNQAQAAIDGWVASPPHHEAMKQSFPQASIGVALCSEYQGEKDQVIIVNYFGVPR